LTPYFSKQKYPHIVLTNDYGILDEMDLNSDYFGVKRPPKNQIVNGKKQKIHYWVFKKMKTSKGMIDANPWSNIISAKNQGQV
jgi:hypothetical protein